MDKRIQGKICPYCKTPFGETDSVVFCSVCDMPHHLSCWQDNQGCTTFGCTGVIKYFIDTDLDMNRPFNTSEQESVALKRQSIPLTGKEDSSFLTDQQRLKSNKPNEIVYESKEVVFYTDLPLALENAVLIIDRSKDKLYARCRFRSLTDEHIKAVLVELICWDVWDSTLGEPIEYQYLDLYTKKGSVFGQTESILLVNKFARKIQVSVKKILLAGGAIVNGGANMLKMPAPITLCQYFQDKDLADEYARETTRKAKYVPEYAGKYWRCTCGALNIDLDSGCCVCGCTRELLSRSLRVESLTSNMIIFARQKKAAEARAQAEINERIRMAEEQLRIDREQKSESSQIPLMRRIEKFLRHRHKKTVVIVAISLVILICGAVYGVSYYKYTRAIADYHNGEYAAAYAAFVELKGFLNSEEWIRTVSYYIR